MEISKLLNTDLDAETLAVCVRLCEMGVNPDALAMVIQELRRETAALKVAIWKYIKGSYRKNIFKVAIGNILKVAITQELK